MSAIQPMDFDGLLLKSGALKRCTVCNQAKWPEKFSRSQKSKDGRGSWCKACISAKGRAYRAANREEVNARKRAWREAHREDVSARKRAWYEANREDVSARKRAWYEANREAVIAQQRAYRAKNPEAVRAKKRVEGARRNAERLGQIPAWADLDAIAEIYAACPQGFEVDHVVPYRGKHGGKRVVSGLHVAENLQYLTPTENSRKRAKHDPAWQIFRPDLLRDAMPPETGGRNG